MVYEMMERLKSKIHGNLGADRFRGGAGLQRELNKWFHAGCAELSVQQFRDIYRGTKL